MKALARAWALAVVMTLACSAGPATATDRALLIGVADYPHLAQRLWLRGPVNDVALMSAVLVARGLPREQQRLLVSRAGGADEPTRAHILAAMLALRQATRPGDRVLLYLAGHGAQQPQPAHLAGRPREADGLDEVFLPADTRQWDGAGHAATIPNALLDDEIGEWMDALVDAGATVFAVFDTCHAAGMARAGGGQRWRALAPAELGLPTPRPRAPAKAQPWVGRQDGRVLAFAARSHEATAEEWLPRGARLGANHVHGVFTYHLAAALRGGAALDGRGLQQQVQAAYGQEQRVSPTPQFQGALDRAWP